MTDHEGGEGVGAGYAEERSLLNPDTSDRENVSSLQLLPEETDTASSYIILDRLLIRDAR